VNHQVANEPVVGRDAIGRMFEREFAAAEMVCIPENIFEDGDWAILEWKDQERLNPRLMWVGCLPGYTMQFLLVKTPTQ